MTEKLIKTGEVRLHNGKLVKGEDKCLHCQEHKAPTTWYGYCGLYLTPEDCGEVFKEVWQQDNIRRVE